MRDEQSDAMKQEVWHLMAIYPDLSGELLDVDHELVTQRAQSFVARRCLAHVCRVHSNVS